MVHHSMEQTPEDIRRFTLNCQIRKGDNRKFKKFVSHTKIEGLRHIFFGRSKIRRFIWLMLFLTALGVCLYAIIVQIIFLASKPTATTISLQRERQPRFPAVTICTLNPVGQMYLEERNLLEFMRSVVLFNDSLCMKSLENATVEEDFDFYSLLHDGRHPASDLFLDCQFEGRPCTPEDFLLTITRLGFCYTFNSGRNDTVVELVSGTGTRHGLELVLNISQDNYIGSRRQEAGVKVAIHPQGVPGEPDDVGIGVPPGRNAFISLREKIIIDESSNRTCQENIIGTYNFLQENYDYSVPACILDCFFANIAKNCSCTEPNIAIPLQLDRELKMCDKEDSCCVGEHYYTYQDCELNCPQLCRYTTYSISTSYSAFPATSAFQLEILGRKLGFDAGDFNLSYIQSNLVAVNIYFEDLNVESEITQNSYTIVSLLADIGGQLGLFIGAGILPIIELCIWILDEIKDRCCGVNEEKLMSSLHIPTGKADKCNPALTELGDPVGFRNPTPTESNSDFEDGEQPLQELGDGGSHKTDQ